MKVREKMRKLLSILLCLCMLVQNAPVMAFAATTDNLCEHHATHTAECGYAEAVAGSDCTHSHDNACGYKEAVTEGKCACTETDENGALVHTEGCGYTAPIAGADCTHTHGDCGYAAPVEAKPCTYHCDICLGHDHGEEEEEEQETTAPSSEATEPSSEATEPDPVCNCGTEDPAIHATTCAVYVRPENPECFCVEKCTEVNEWCDVCGFDISKCGGTDTSAAYADTELQVEAMYAVGNGSGAWLNGSLWDPVDDSNRMTEIADGIYEITYTGVNAGNDYQVSFSANGSWDYKWNGTYVDSGVKTDAVFHGNNICFSVPKDGSSVKLRFDLSGYDHATRTGAQFTITVIEETSSAVQSSITIGAMENGSVTADKGSAAEGETVTLTVKPAEGYVLDTLSVKQGETDVTVTDNTFIMPAAAVTVSASFKVCTHTFDESGECTLCSAQAMAKVDDTYYTDFATALANWTDGTTLTLLDNVSIDSLIELAYDTTLTLVGGEHTLTLNAALHIYGTLNINGGTIHPVSGIGEIFVDSSDSELSVQGSTIMDCAIQNSGTILLNDTTLDVSAFYAINNFGKVNIKGNSTLKCYEYDSAAEIRNPDGGIVVIETTEASPEGWRIQNAAHAAMALSCLTLPTDYYVFVGDTIVTELAVGEIGTIKQHLHTFEYSDHGNGTHNKVCTGCGYEATEDHTFDESGKCVCKAQASVKVQVGDSVTYYPGIDEANAYAGTLEGSDPVSITLLGDTTASEFQFAARTMVLDLNGHTMTVNQLRYASGADVTVKDSGEDGKIQVTGSHYVSNSASLTLESGTILCDKSYQNAVTVEQGTFRMTGGTVSGVTGAINVQFGGKVSISSGTIDGGSSKALSNLSESKNISLSGGTYIGGISSGTPFEKITLLDILVQGYKLVDENGTNVNLYGTSADGTVRVVCAHTLDHAGNKEATCKAPAYCGNCGEPYGDPLAHEMDPATGLCKYDCGTQVAAASTTVDGNTVYHSTVYEAILAVRYCNTENEAEVTLLRDHFESIPINEGVFTLNLNGNTVHVERNSSAALDFAGGTVTVTGGTLIGTRKAVVVRGGTLNFTDGTITATLDHDSAKAVDMYGNGTLNVSGGTITGLVKGIHVRESATLNITNGTIRTEGKYRSGSIYMDSGTVHISGGTFYDAYTLRMEAGEAYVTGGTFHGERYDIGGNGAGGVHLGLPEDGTTGAIFPDGLKSLVTLNAILDEGLAYWQDGKQITLTEDQDEIPGGTVTIMAACDHSGNTNKTHTDNRDGTHSLICSVCKLAAETGDHSGGEATCQKLAECEACGTSYGVLAAHSFGLSETCIYGCGTRAQAKVDYEYYATLPEALAAAEEKISDGAVLGVYVDPLADYAGDLTISLGIIFRGEGHTFSGAVTNNGDIWSGTFSGVVTNENDILGGTFNGTVYNNKRIGGGSFNNKVTNNADIFNEKPGSIALGDNFVIENTATGTVLCRYHFWKNGKCRLCAEDCAHTLRYTANGSTITAACSKNCGHTATATISATGKTYDGIAAEATMSYSNNWPDTSKNLAITYAVKDGAALTEAPKNAGTYTASITMGEGENAATASAEFTIAKRELIPTVSGSVSKTYDGTTDVPASHSLSITLDGIIIGDDISATASYAYDGVNVDDKTIIATNITLGGADAGNYTLKATTASADVGTINKADVVITAEEQTITYGETISVDAFNAENLVDGHTVTVTLTPSTAKVTANGTITPSAAVITADGTDVTGNYNVSYTSGKLVIQPDTSGIDDLTKDNVTSADEDDIKAVQKMLEDAESTREEWDTIPEKCEELLDRIAEVEEEQKELIDSAAAFDEDTVKSTELEDLKQLEKEIEDLLDTDNLTEEERKALEDVQDQVEDMIDTIEETAADSKAATGTIDALDPATVTSDDQDELEQAIDTIDQLLKDDHLTDDERNALEDAKADAEELLEKIEAVQDALDTENTEKVEDVTADNVKPGDKEALEDAKADLEKALKDNAGNYTNEEKKAIQEELDRISDALEALEKVEDVTDAIRDLPQTVAPDTEKAAKILDTKKAYDALTGHEKSLIEKSLKEKLAGLVADLTDYDIIKGDGSSWMKGSGYGLSFTANGPFSKFVGIEVDGKKVAERYYDAKAGSTVITLKASFLKWKSVGKHTITVIYTDGETSGTFRIQAETESPATGDNFNLTMWSSVAISSLLCMAALILNKKRFFQK